MKYFLLSILLLCSFCTYAQLHNYNPKDTFFYFKNYDFYLNKNTLDTSKLYLKLDSKLIDVKKISGNLYNGIFEFAKFKILRKNRQIIVSLFDQSKNELKTEKYNYKNIVAIRQDTYFYSLTPGKRVLVWKIITPSPE